MGAVRERVEQPPAHVRFAFWVIGFRVDERWLPWAEREIRSVDYTVKRAATFAAFLFTLQFILWIVVAIVGDRTDHFELSSLIAVPMGGLIGGMMAGERGRKLALRYQRGELWGGERTTFRDFVIWGGGGIAAALIVVAIVLSLT